MDGRGITQTALQSHTVGEGAHSSVELSTGQSQTESASRIGPVHQDSDSARNSFSAFFHEETLLSTLSIFSHDGSPRPCSSILYPSSRWQDSSRIFLII